MRFLQDVYSPPLSTVSCQGSGDIEQPWENEAAGLALNNTFSSMTCKT